MDDIRPYTKALRQKAYFDNVIRSRRAELYLGHTAAFYAARPVVATKQAGEPTINEIPRRAPLQQRIMMAMACLIFLIGMLVSLQAFLANQDSKAQVAALADNSSGRDGNTPSEAKPNSSNYQVAPTLPKYIKVPKIGISARVISLGVTDKNALQAPNNIYDAGWYDASARPGDAAGNGAILIDGHVHGPTLPGVFANIGKLSAGDTLRIVRGDNKVFTYKVVKVQNYDAKTLDMAMMITSIRPGIPGLNLITCGGKYDMPSHSYTQRTVVFSVQI